MSSDLSQDISILESVLLELKRLSLNLILSLRARVLPEHMKREFEDMTERFSSAIQNFYEKDHAARRFHQHLN